MNILIDLLSTEIELAHKVAEHMNQSLLMLCKFIFSFFVYTDLMHGVIQTQCHGSDHMHAALITHNYIIHGPQLTDTS